MVILRYGRHADADAGLLGVRMDCVGAVDVGEGEAEVLLHGAQAEVFGVEVNQGAQQSGRTLLPELLAAPQALLLHSTPQRALERAATLSQCILGNRLVGVQGAVTFMSNLD